MKAFLFGLSIIIVGCMTLSCEKDSSLQTPKYTPHLVMHSFISPQDTILYVHIGASRNLYGPLRDFPDKLPASVSLFDGDKEIVFQRSDSMDIYESRYKIEAGKEYKITAKCAGYPDISAITRVPEDKPVTVLMDTTSEVHNFEWGTYRLYKLTVKFTDPHGERNFYNLYTLDKVNGRYGKSASPLYQIQQKDEYNYNAEKIISDHLIDGKVIMTAYSYYSHSKDTTTYSQELEGCILKTDEAYYKYHTSMRKYSGTDDPFTEFSPVYSNVSGGYGIFASYVAYKKVLKLK